MRGRTTKRGTGPHSENSVSCCRCGSRGPWRSCSNTSCSEKSLKRCSKARSKTPTGKNTSCCIDSDISSPSTTEESATKSGSSENTLPSQRPKATKLTPFDSTTSTQDPLVPFTTRLSTRVLESTGDSGSGKNMPNATKLTTLDSTTTTQGKTVKSQPLRQNNAGNIAGGVVGSLVFVGLGVLVFLILWRRRKHNNRDNKQGSEKNGFTNFGSETSVEQSIYHTIDDATVQNHQNGLLAYGFEKPNKTHESDKVYSSIKQGPEHKGELATGLNSASMFAKGISLPETYDHLSTMKTQLEQNTVGNTKHGPVAQVLNLPNTYDHLNRMKTEPEQSKEGAKELVGVYSELDGDYQRNTPNADGYFVLEIDGVNSSQKPVEDNGISTSEPDNGYFVLEKSPNPTTGSDLENVGNDSNAYFVLEKDHTDTQAPVTVDDPQSKRILPHYEHLVDPGKPATGNDVYSELITK